MTSFQVNFFNGEFLMANNDPFEHLSKQDQVNSRQATTLLKGLAVEYVAFDTKARNVLIRFNNGKEFKVNNLNSILDVSIENKVN